jgi:hypothetical protein
LQLPLKKVTMFSKKAIKNQKEEVSVPRHFAGGGNFCDHSRSKKGKTSPSPSKFKDNLFINFVK